jgi:two-component system, OmpR family, response regulator MprA
VKEQAGTVLIVDDDEDFREIASRILHQAGYSTREAATGEEALEIAGRERPQLVLLDVRLSGRLSGHQVCRMLKDGVQPEAAILFVSGARIESYDRAGGLLIGADDYIVKPFAADELIARVRALIRRTEPSRTPSSELTGREQEVVRLLKDGLGQAEIARKLGINSTTARRHIEHVFAKLGA